MANIRVSSPVRIVRLALFLAAFAAVVNFAACGGNGSSSPVVTSNLTNRAFISNNFSGGMQVVDTQQDITATSGNVLNQFGQIVPGAPLTIPVTSALTFEVESPNHSVTMAYNPNQTSLWFVSNSSEQAAGDVSMGSMVTAAVFSPDSSKVYAAEPNLVVSGASRHGGIQVLDRPTATITASYAVASARYIALSPSGQYLLAFADNSDSVFLIDLNASTVAPVEVPGFARPINAFFSSDNSTAYVLNCGPECGSSSPASVASLDIASKTVTATVEVGGASVGLLNGTTLYVAGSPVPPGTMSTYDAVNVSNMTRITADSVAIGDGFHSTMALAPNNKLYIGASTCNNTMTGCLSVVDVSSNTADPALPPRGAITSLLSVKNRNVIYAIEGGVLHIYNTANNSLQPTQLNFTGALYGIVQVDP